MQHHSHVRWTSQSVKEMLHAMWTSYLWGKKKLHTTATHRIEIMTSKLDKLGYRHISLS